MVYFYVPGPALVADLPASIDEYWTWADAAIRRAPAALGNGRGPCPWAGPYNWTIQTYLYLKQVGFACTVTATLPDAGVVVTHGDFLPPDLQPAPEQFIVEIKPDRPLQGLFSNFLVVQNRRDPIHRGFQRWLVPSAHVNYWPQPGLRPRAADRGERFERACFMGNPEQFLVDVPQLAAEVEQLGLTWQMVPRERWNDYRDVDAIVAVRPPAPANLQHTGYATYFAPDRKPASKLYNAWLAGVPAILSPDVAFRDLRRSPFDYLEAESVSSIVNALRQLQSDPELRRKMVENGRQRAAEFSAERTTRAWIDILEHQVLPRYAAWQRSPLRRRWLFLSRRLLRQASAA